VKRRSDWNFYTYSYGEGQQATVHFDLQAALITPGDYSCCVRLVFENTSKELENSLLDELADVDGLLVGILSYGQQTEFVLQLQDKADFVVHEAALVELGATFEHVEGWGYFDDPCIAGHEEAAARDLLEHYNTALTLNHRYLPHPKVDAKGNFTEPMDFTKLDRMLAWNPKCRLWLIWVGFEFGFNRMGTPSFGTPVWENAFTQYVTGMRDHLAEKGIGKERFAWYWSDEPGGERWEKFDHVASQLLKRIDPEMLVWANPTRRLTVQQFKASLPYVDIFCPSLGTLGNGAVLDVCHATRRPSWLYVCASEKNADPFGYYRWLSWKAWKNKLGGIGMWVYVDANGQTFSDYVSGVSYAMVYKGEKGPIGSKRWDAWRQGIADYEYLRMLSDAVAAARKAGGKEDACARAETILGQGVEEIVGQSPHGGDSANRDLPDACRRRILQCLSELRGGSQ